MASLHPYLNFPGNTEEAFQFYRSVFGGEFMSVVRFGDTPEAARFPEADRHKLMHIALPIGKGVVLMGTDTLESMGQKLTFGNNMSLSFMADSRAGADEHFAKLSAGGTVTVPMQDMFWGDYFGMVKDKFGICWMVSYNAQQHQPQAEMAAAEPAAK